MESHRFVGTYALLRSFHNDCKGAERLARMPTGGLGIRCEINRVNRVLETLDIYLTFEIDLRGNIMGKQFGAFEFVQVSMSDDDFEACDVWATKQDLDTLLSTLLGDGLKISFSFKSETGSFSCTLSGIEGSKMYAGKGLSGFSDSPTEALSIAAYKHIVMFKRNEWRSAQKRIRG